MIRNHTYLIVTSICLVFLFFPPKHLFSYELVKRIQSFTLKNGLRILMVKHHLSPTVAQKIEGLCNWISYRSEYRDMIKINDVHIS